MIKIELLSFAVGVLFALALVIVAETVYGKIFGNRKLREQAREIKRLQGIIHRKDELVRKSLKSMQDMENKNAKTTREN
jgi:hypothetical protein